MPRDASKHPAIAFIQPASSVLPRLIYIADLEVFPSYAGALQIYRLLEPYPREHLLLVYPGANDRQGLSGARHLEPPVAWWARYAERRGGKHLLLLMNWLTWAWWKTRGRPPGWLLEAATAFKPEAVLTVGLGGAWVLADDLAQHLGLPLHVIVHDDRHYCSAFPAGSHAWIERRFGRVLARAASVLPVSQPMNAVFRQRFRVAGEVINPTRDRQLDALPPPSFQLNRPLRLVYAGSIWTDSTLDLLDGLGRELRQHGGSLSLYLTNPPPPARAGWHFDLHPSLPPAELVTVLRTGGGVLLQIASFEADARETVATLFPSKLVDYSATGLPVFMVGPDYSSTAWLARQYPEAFAFVGSNDPAVIAKAFLAFASQPSRLEACARNFWSLGRDLFSQSGNFARFSRCLDRKTSSGTDRPPVCVGQEVYTAP
jgi:hypothetical protein